MTNDLTPHERAHVNAKREAIRKRAARQGFTLRTDGVTDDDSYSLIDRHGRCIRGDLQEIADELRARREPRQRRAA